MTRVISIFNAQQGGGKTTTVINLATAFKQRRANVLAVDLSAEAVLSQRIRPSNAAHRARTEPKTQIVSTAEGWHLMSSTASIPLLHARAVHRVTRTTIWQDELRSRFDAYDYVLLDCSTSENSLLLEALALSDEVIVPLNSESLQFYDAIDRLRELLDTRVSFNPGLRFGGVFLEHYDPRFRRARDIMTALFDALGPVNCFSAYLTDSPEIRQAEERRSSVVLDAPTSKAARVFGQLATQITATTPLRLLAPSPTESFPVPVELGESGFLPVFESVRDELTAGTQDWLRLAQDIRDPDQAIRYTVLALDQDPGSAAALERFESRLIERLDKARFQDVENLLTLGQFLTEHRFDHYASQLFRRAIELNPAVVGGWAGLALTTHEDTERAQALNMCLQLDEGFSATESAATEYRSKKSFLKINPRTLVGAAS